MKWEAKCQMLAPRADSTEITSIEDGWEPFGVGALRIYLRRQVPEKGPFNSPQSCFCAICGELPNGNTKWVHDHCAKDVKAEIERRWNEKILSDPWGCKIRAETLKEVGEWMNKHPDYKWYDLKRALKSGRMPE